MDFVSLLATFVRIADSGSLSKAARSLRLSVPMVSRHLRTLEGELGVPLVRRTTRRMDLTDAGLELLPRARRLLAGVEEAREAVRPGKGARGALTLSVPVSFGLAKVTPLIPKLLAQNPQLSLEVRFEDRAVDLLEEGVDLAIRAGKTAPDSPFIVARSLAQYERILCAAPSFLKRHPVVKPEALSTVPFLVLAGAGSRVPLETPQGPMNVSVSGPLRSNNMLALHDAAVAGLGVAQLPRWLVRDDLAAGRLVRVLEATALPLVHVLGLVHSDARHAQSLRTLLDYFAAELPRVLDGAVAGPARTAARAPPHEKSAAPRG